MPALRFPRPITAIHQIEITSRCNLRCVYCPSPSIVAGKYPNRPAVDMKRYHFERALLWVEFYRRWGGQPELNLAGIGESTLHPEFVDFVRMARRVMGDEGHIVFATNGILCDEIMVKDLAKYKVRVWVSLHRPEKAARAVELYKKYGLLVGVSIDPSVNSNDWAGQVDWHRSGNEFPCPWLNEGRLFVLSDGRISRCCLDAQGVGILGHVDDPIGSIETSPYSLCMKCYQTIDSPTWDQKRGVGR